MTTVSIVSIITIISVIMTIVSFAFVVLPPVSGLITPIVGTTASVISKSIFKSVWVVCAVDGNFTKFPIDDQAAAVIRLLGLGELVKMAEKLCEPEHSKIW